ncbi:MAG: FAD-dependent oxidoreductase [Acidimicrobiales bacterium]|nr:FAD-dependent oxidoreductase [Acidimicrobiales bacterium]
MYLDKPHRRGEPLSRAASLERLSGTRFDVLVVGGGINGAVSALSLAAHGLKVGLVEASDFASGTSQESSNMIWGGFKYLESYDLRLVAGLCRSRNRLAAAYPTRILETRFMAVLQHGAPFAPWFAALGANAYWALGRLHTRRPRHRSRSTIHRLEPAVEASRIRGGIEYSDYLLADNDARFVSEFVIAAEQHGAVVANYLELEEAEYNSDIWSLTLRDQVTGSAMETTARVLVNAAGPRVPTIGSLTLSTTQSRLVYSKGVHLTVPRVTDSGRILAFFDDARRLFYVLPMGDRSVIGTTDTPVDDPEVSVTDEDRLFLLGQVSRRLNLDRNLDASDIISERCGVRALVVPPGGSGRRRDWTELSRRHAVETDDGRVVVSILGGKLSDCLNVGAEVVDAVRLCGLRPMPPAQRWFGEPSQEDRRSCISRAAGLGIAPDAAALIWRRHGRRMDEVLDLVRGDPALGGPLGDLDTLSMAEVMVMGRHERIVRPDDLLRRRTMLSMLHRPETVTADRGVRSAIETILGSDGLTAFDAGSAALDDADV